MVAAEVDAKSCAARHGAEARHGRCLRLLQGLLRGKGGVLFQGEKRLARVGMLRSVGFDLRGVRLEMDDLAGGGVA